MPAAATTPSEESSFKNQTATATLLMNGVSHGEFNSNLNFQFYSQATEMVNDEVIMQVGSDGQLPKR